MTKGRLGMPKTVFAVADIADEVCHVVFVFVVVSLIDTVVPTLVPSESNYLVALALIISREVS